jgi:hypothetical protein
MIEDTLLMHLPSERGMTGIACFGCERGLVRRLMTGGAVLKGACSKEDRFRLGGLPQLRMALLAAHIAVFPFSGKAGSCVIEP